MADTALILGLAGIGGTALSGGLTPWVAWKIAQRRLRHEQDETAALVATELRRAARLVRDELSNDAAVAKVCANRGHWWPEGRVPPSADDWQRYRESLASLHDDEFLAVSGAYRRVALNMAQRPIALDGEPRGPDLTAAATADLREVEAACATAILALRRASEDPPTYT